MVNLDGPTRNQLIPLKRAQKFVWFQQDGVTVHTSTTVYTG